MIIIALISRRGNGDVCSLKSSANARDPSSYGVPPSCSDPVCGAKHRSTYAYERDHVPSHPSCNSGVRFGNPERTRRCVPRDFRTHVSWEPSRFYLFLLPPQERSPEIRRICFEEFLRRLNDADFASIVSPRYCKSVPSNFTMRFAYRRLIRP